jgi:hypothetical protein
MTICMRVVGRGPRGGWTYTSVSGRPIHRRLDRSGREVLVLPPTNRSSSYSIDFHLPFPPPLPLRSCRIATHHPPLDPAATTPISSMSTAHLPPVAQPPPPHCRPPPTVGPRCPPLRSPLCPTWLSPWIAQNSNSWCRDHRRH